MEQQPAVPIIPTQERAPKIRCHVKFYERSKNAIVTFSNLDDITIDLIERVFGTLKINYNIIDNEIIITSRDDIMKILESDQFNLTLDNSYTVEVVLNAIKSSNKLYERARKRLGGIPGILHRRKK